MIKKMLLIIFCLSLGVSQASGALDFSGTISDKVNHGTDTSLDNLTTGTYLAWVYPNDLTPSVAYGIIWKGLFGTGYRFFALNNDPQLVLVLRRATTDLEAFAPISSTNIAANKWNFIAGVHDSGGADSVQELYTGDLNTIAVEVSSYDSQIVGVGVTQDNSTADQIIGNRENDSREFNGLIAFVGIWNRVLTLGEIQAQQFKPHKTSGCVLFTYYGFNGTGTQTDYSGNSNNGTVTGATIADHVPLPAPFGG